MSCAVAYTELSLFGLDNNSIRICKSQDTNKISYTNISVIIFIFQFVICNLQFLTANF